MDEISSIFFSFLVFTIKDLFPQREVRRPAETEVLVFIFGSVRRIKPVRSVEPQFVPFNNCRALDHMMLAKFIMSNKIPGKLWRNSKIGNIARFPCYDLSL